MKPILACVFVLALTCGIVWAFSGNPLIIGWYKPPPRSLPEAYAIALQRLAPYTTNNYCYEARISHERDRAGEWVFKFQPNPDSPLHSDIYVAMQGNVTEERRYFGSSLVTNIISGK